MIKLYEEYARCLLCDITKCSQACIKGFEPAKMVRSVRFENEKGAAKFLDASVCAECSGECESACIHYDMPIRIREMSRQLPKRSDCPDKQPGYTLGGGGYDKNPSSFSRCDNPSEGRQGFGFRTLHTHACSFSWWSKDDSFDRDSGVHCGCI